MKPGHRVRDGAERQREEGAHGKFRHEFRGEVREDAVRAARAFAIDDDLLGRERGERLHQRRHRRVDGGHLQQAETILDARLRASHAPKDGPEHERAVERRHQANAIHAPVATNLAPRPTREEEKLRGEPRRAATRRFSRRRRMARRRVRERARLGFSRGGFPRRGLERGGENPRDDVSFAKGRRAVPVSLPSRPRLHQRVHARRRRLLRLGRRRVRGHEVHEKFRGVTRGGHRVPSRREPTRGVGGGAAIHDATPPRHEAHVVEQIDDGPAGLVDGRDDRLSLVARQIAKGFHHALRLKRVEAAGGFVGAHDGGRIADEFARQR